STTAGSWGRYLYGVSKRAFTKWALSLAGGAVVVGYLAEKFAASEGVFLSSSTAGNNEGESLATSGGEEPLNSASPDPKPIPPPVVSTDTETHASYTEEDETPIFESMDDKAFKALLNKHNIKAKDYQKFKNIFTYAAMRSLHVSGGVPGVIKINPFRYYLQQFRDQEEWLPPLSMTLQQELREEAYIFDALYYLLADTLKLIKNGALGQFQGLSLVEDGYALYTRPLLKTVAAQLPNILKEACASPGLSHLEFSDCLELYSRSLLKDASPFDSDAGRIKNFLNNALNHFKTGSVTDPAWMKLTLYSVITSKIEE
ncbi:MAG: hypothetical protein OXC44_00355, partial [Proteobacteria bacterium]|nr:hypothetical protein [Pseudomonadota bacterium]